MSRRIFLNDGKRGKAGDTLKAAGTGGDVETDCEKRRGGFLPRRDSADDRGGYGEVGRVLITLEDLQRISRRLRETLRAKYESGGHEWEVLTSPPPSSGGVAIIEALNMLKDVPLKGGDER